MKIQKLKLTSEQCIQKINSICNDLEIEVEINEKSDHIVLKLLRDEENPGTIRIYDSKKGRTLDGSMNNTIINDEVLNLFLNEGGRIEATYSIYKLKTEQWDTIKNIIIATAAKSEYFIEDKSADSSHCYYAFQIKHPVNIDKIMVTQYNTGNLMIQGKGWEVWEEICNAIELTLDTPVTEMTLRMMGLKEGDEITNVITSSLTKDAEKEVKSLLEESFDFLYDHDKKLVISAQSMLLSKVDYGDYYCYVAPCLRVVEGYLKKIIIELDLFSETEILAVDSNGRPKFHFGLVFNGEVNVLSGMKGKLSNNQDEQDKMEKALLVVYKIYRDTRNPYYHNGPPEQSTVNTYEDAESIINEVIGMIEYTYKELF